MKTTAKWLYPASLIVLFIILVSAVIPDRAVYGSNTDWLSQHVTLAETIRTACLEQHTLLPDWIGLGGGSNGYQFAYYGFLRPDLLIGCLLPQIPMVQILIGYMLSVYLCSVLLCYAWLRSETFSPAAAWFGSILFMTAGCLFHMHRQIMFVNYLPFLLLAFLCVKSRRWKWLPLCMVMICLSSFYFAPAAFAAIAWYGYRSEALSSNLACNLPAGFLRGTFLKRFLPSVLLAAGMSAALLLPVGMVLLEHQRSGSGFSLRTVLELFAPNPVFNNILFNEYGMGLTLICLYAILAGLRIRKMRPDSILFLLFGMFGIFSYILNGTLYARPKILIPFMPLVILHCLRVMRQMYTDRLSRLPLWPFAVLIPVSLFWFSQPQFPWILAELGILFCLCMIARFRKVMRIKSALPCILMLLTAPVGMYFTTAGTEDWVNEADISSGFSSEDLADCRIDPRWHFDSLTSPLVSGNEYNAGLTRSTMYSSITNSAYSELYYDILMTPIRINNRVAVLTSDNPFMLRLLGARFLETPADEIPAGYKEVLRSGDTVLAENEHTLPSVYFTNKTISREAFETLDDYDKLDALTRRTIVDDSGATVSDASGIPEGGMQIWKPVVRPAGEDSLPEGLSVTRTENGWEIRADKTCSLSLAIDNPVPGSIVLCEFQVRNHTTGAVIIDINRIRNKLSGRFAPYPNGNDRFHYQFSTDEESGVNRLDITFSKGHYELTDFQWHIYDQTLLKEQTVVPISRDGTITAETDGYLATSVPMQNGLEILVDGKPADLVEINTAFAGVRLEKGIHTIDFRFTPPGKSAGCLISCISVGVYILFLASACIRRELFTYLISGGITTAVNYILYAALLALQLPLLAANSAAWAGAVLTAYALNRCLVFHSQKPVGGELASFAALRLVTLLAENALLWLLVIRLGAPAFPAKLLVSVVTVVGNYVLCKFGIFRKETVSHG